MYKALYRKWRPMTFDDVISQQQTTDTLKKQIISGKTAHAYLFTGSRGTGKTTCARILAKAVTISVISVTELFILLSVENIKYISSTRCICSPRAPSMHS